ncbi:hypothetical protein pb186bvf_015550 [Paramecium bursaria]
MSTTSNSLNGYTIITEIGAGSEGVVLKAQKEGQIFAIKQTQKIQSRLDIIDMMIAEQKYFSNIIKHYEWFIHEDQTYIVMEYADENLNDLMKKHKFTQIDKFIIMKEIAQGIKQFHDKKLIHRDIKLENIVLVQEGRKLKPKICDIGLLKERQFNNTYKVGSPLFQAPEVDFQKQQYGQQADIWSFGMFCYELQTCKPMIEAFTHQQLNDWFNSFNKDPQIVRKKLDDTIQNKQLAVLIENCLNFDQSLRPNIHQILQSIQEIIAIEDQIVRKQRIKIVPKCGSTISNKDNQQLDYLSIVQHSRSEINQQVIDRLDQPQENIQIKKEQIQDILKSQKIQLHQSQIIKDQPDQQIDESQYIQINLLANKIVQVDKPQIYNINLNQQNNNHLEHYERSIESDYNLQSSQFIVKPSNQIIQSSERMFILEKQKKVLEQAIKNKQIVKYIWENSQETTISQYIKQNRKQLAQIMYDTLF